MFGVLKPETLHLPPAFVGLNDELNNGFSLLIKAMNKITASNMKMNLLLPIAAMSCLLSNCTNEKGSGDKLVEEIKTDGKISSIVRNPITMEGPLDTVNVAKMTFEEAEFDFGEVKEGEVVTHVFKFTNTGKAPLVINNAQSTCGCTVPQWPKDPIDPGKSGEIKVEFNTKAKTDFQEKPITISANTYPSNTKIFLRGFVRKAEG
jgi:uncharacterized cupredoxin-like copper-binding protein